MVLVVTRKHMSVLSGSLTRHVDGSTTYFEPKLKNLEQIVAVVGPAGPVGVAIESALTATLGNVDVAYATRTELEGDLAWPADSIALVYADVVQANNDLYVKVGDSGAGSWALTNALHDGIQAAAQPYVDAVVAPYRWALDGSLRQMLLASAASVPFPDGFNPGRALALDPANDVFSYGAYEVDPAVAFEYSRAGSMEAVGGGARVTFGADELPVHAGKFFVGAGGTNLFLHTEDFSQTIWTKEGGRVTLGATSAGPAGAGTAQKLVATTDNNTHIFRQTQNTTSTLQTLRFWVKADGWSKVRLAVFGNNGRGGRADFDLSAGTYSNAFGHSAGLGDSATAVMWAADGGYYIELRAVLGSAPTSALFYFYILNDSGATSFAGDGTKGVIASLPIAEAGVSKSGPYIKSTGTRGARSAATLALSPPPDFYILRTVDALGEQVDAFEIENYGDTITLDPRAGGEFATIELFIADYYDDFSLRADTEDGQLGTPQKGHPHNPLTIQSGFPMIPATFGKIEGGAVKIAPENGATGRDRTFYAPRDAGAGRAWNTISIEYSFHAGINNGGALSAQAVTVLLSTDPDDPGSVDRLILNMPGHIVSGRSSAQFQKRATGEAAPFPTVGQINHVNFQKDGAHHTMLVRRYGDIVKLTVGGLEIICQDAILAQDCQIFGFEITSNTGNTDDTAHIHKVWASTAQIGDVPVYAAASPVVLLGRFLTPSGPSTYTAGCLLTPTSDTDVSVSNAGAIVVTPNQWRKGGVDIPGETGGTLQTASPADVRGVFTCLLEYANDEGTTLALSRPTNPLAAP